MTEPHVALLIFMLGVLVWILGPLLLGFGLRPDEARPRVRRRASGADDGSRAADVCASVAGRNESMPARLERERAAEQAREAAWQAHISNINRREAKYARLVAEYRDRVEATREAARRRDAEYRDRVEVSREAARRRDAEYRNRVDATRQRVAPTWADLQALLDAEIAREAAREATPRARSPQEAALAGAYQLVGLPVDADDERVRVARRSQLAAAHPDRCPEGPARVAATARFKEINAAFHVIFSSRGLA